MSSKVKTVKTYIVHHTGKAPNGSCGVQGRYRVGARNEKEACEFLRKAIGKHVKTRVYYEEKAIAKQVAYGTVIKELGLSEEKLL